MPAWWTEVRTFLQQYRANFKHTGAVLPSGGSLGRALTRYVRRRDGDAPPQSGTAPQAGAATNSPAAVALRILEVGPGTGAVTKHIAAALRPGDQFDMTELNEAFCMHLRERFAAEPPFCHVSTQSRVLHCPIEQLSADEPYDLIISGLPLNNFNVDEVEHILGIFERLLKPGGTLSFFEYIGIRKVRALVSDAQGRKRLRGIEAAMNGILRRGEIHRDHVWPNVPPAYVHHVRFATASA
ncbi:MAG: methyltransferase domain-containing protein [Pirellulales bacterium]